MIYVSRQEKVENRRDESTIINIDNHIVGMDTLLSVNCKRLLLVIHLKASSLSFFRLSYRKFSFHDCQIFSTRDGNVKKQARVGSCFKESSGAY